jgi:hypothetical protein
MQIKVEEVVRTCYVEVDVGPRYRVDVVRERAGRYYVRCWLIELFQVEVPQLARGQRKAEKCHPTLLDETVGLGADSKKRHRTAAAALRAFVRGLERHFG